MKDAFAEYVGMFSFMDRFYDKTILEYKTRPGTTVRLHYMLESKENQGGEYHTTEMKDIYNNKRFYEFNPTREIKKLLKDNIEKGIIDAFLLYKIKDNG